MKSVRYSFLFLVCCLQSFAVNGQRYAINTDLGVFAGTSYYLGDINPRRQFYSPGLSFGALLKHNISPHHTLRVNAYYGQFAGNDLDFKNDYQQFRAGKFETSLVDAHIGYEFNFLPYLSTREHPNAHSPFLFFGIGYSLVVSSTVDDISNGYLNIPFGVGYKYRFNPAISAGAEWGMRKTFADDMDGVANPGITGSYNFLHNNDWCSYVGIFITFRIFEQSFSCPAYKQPIVYK
ncbi:MAG: DUF6089 family protein [Bacteroidales bacterium]|nr:DUF6089 family protein [Bacteroidales bacterium]